MSSKGPFLILLLAGWSGSGKDTFANILIEKYGFIRLAFADAVKRVVARNLRIPIDLCNTQEGKQTLVAGKTVRAHLIEYAEKFRANQGKGFWAEELLRHEFESGFQHRRIVITDWRHLQELFEVQKFFMRQPPTELRHIIPILIRRPIQLVSPVPDQTEYSLLGFPFQLTVHNAEGIPHLEKEAKRVMHFCAARELLSVSCCESCDAHLIVWRDLRASSPQGPHPDSCELCMQHPPPLEEHLHPYQPVAEVYLPKSQSQSSMN